MQRQRSFIVGGNWKMNGSIDLVNTISSSLDSLEKDIHVMPSFKVIVFPPTPFLIPARHQFPQWIQLGAQITSSKSEEGAYTGEVSSTILKSLQVEWVIVGHSERRQYFDENEETIKAKIKSCFDANINVIYCIGESLRIRESNQIYEHLDNQLESVLVSLIKGNESKIVIAYEPIWAIGTGIVAKSHQIQEALQHIMKWLKRFFPFTYQYISIIYGGSVNAKNCIELANIPELDGFLVGGASISQDFCTIITQSLAQIKRSSNSL